MGEPMKRELLQCRCDATQRRPLGLFASSERLQLVGMGGLLGSREMLVCGSRRRRDRLKYSDGRRDGEAVGARRRVRHTQIPPVD